MWFDLLLILSFAWNGLVLGLASLLNVHFFLAQKLGYIRSWIAVLLLLVLCGFGIYLGRFLRWNSWDAFTDPLSIIGSSFRVLSDPSNKLNATGFTIIFTGLLAVSYLFFVGMISPFHGRKENDRTLR